MQATGQYHGVPDVPQFVGTRVPPPHGHMFNISQEMPPPPPAVSSASHNGTHGVAAIAAAAAAAAGNNHGHGLSLSHSSPHQHQHQQHHHQQQQNVTQQQFTQLLSQQQQQQQQQFHIQSANPQQSQSAQMHPGFGNIGSNTTVATMPMTASLTMPTNTNIPTSDSQHHQQHQFQNQIRSQGPGSGTTPAAPNQLSSGGIGGGSIDNEGSASVEMMTNSITNNNNNGKVQSMVREGSEDGDELQDEELGDRGGGGNRWPRQEAMALLKIRADMDAAFKDSSLKTPLWEEISRKMAELGYQRSAKKCKEKFENVHKYYKRTKDGKAGRQDGKNYRFFSQLEALYGKSGDNNSNSISNNNNNITNNNNNGNNNNSQLPSSAASMQLPSSNVYNGGDITGLGLMASSRAPANNYSLQRHESIKHDHTNTAFNFSFDVTSDEEDDDGDEDDDEYGEPTHGTAAADGPAGNPRKRKRARTMNKYLHFFEKVMKKVLEKQEEMQQRFLEALERRDKERMEREKNWRMQEMTRMSRENDVRAQERALSASRDASIIAFLQKASGISISLPPQIAMQPASLNYQPAPAPASAAMVPLSTITTHQEEAEYNASDRDIHDPNSKRWPKTEVLSLIKLRTDLDKRFHEPGSKAVLWEEISSKMSALGYSRSAKRCKEKWENINKYFKKAKESNKKRPEDAKTCPYFHHLNALYKQGLLGGGGSNIKQGAHVSRDKATGVDDNSDQDVNTEQPNTSNTGREDSGPGQEDVDSDDGLIDGSEETTLTNPHQNEIPNPECNDESTGIHGDGAKTANSGAEPTPSNEAVMHLFFNPDSRVINVSINDNASTDAANTNKQAPAASNSIPMVMAMDQ